MNPFRFVIELPERPNHPARSVEMRVSYSVHVFTTGQASPGADEYSDGREVRWFDHERYQQSFRLRNLIKNIERQNCYVARRKNFVTIEVDGPLTEYRLFFGMKKIGDDNIVALYAESAYVGDPAFRPQDVALKPTGFRVLLSSVLLDSKKGFRY